MYNIKTDHEFIIHIYHVEDVNIPPEQRKRRCWSIAAMSLLGWWRLLYTFWLRIRELNDSNLWTKKIVTHCFITCTYTYIDWLHVIYIHIHVYWFITCKYNVCMHECVYNKSTQFHTCTIHTVQCMSYTFKIHMLVHVHIYPYICKCM